MIEICWCISDSLFHDWCISLQRRVIDSIFFRVVVNDGNSWLGRPTMTWWSVYWIWWWSRVRRPTLIVHHRWCWLWGNVDAVVVTILLEVFLLRKITLSLKDDDDDLPLLDYHFLEKQRRQSLKRGISWMLTTSVSRDSRDTEKTNRKTKPWVIIERDSRQSLDKRSHRQNRVLDSRSLCTSLLRGCSFWCIRKEDYNSKGRTHVSMILRKWFTPCAQNQFPCLRDSFSHRVNSLKQRVASFLFASDIPWGYLKERYPFFENSYAKSKTKKKLQEHVPNNNSGSNFIWSSTARKGWFERNDTNV